MTNNLEQEYKVLGKTITLSEYKEAVPNLMNNGYYTNKYKALKLITITNGMVEASTPKNEISDVINSVISKVKSSHNRQILKEMSEMLIKDDSWEITMKEYFK